MGNSEMGINGNTDSETPHFLNKIKDDILQNQCIAKNRGD